MSLNDKKRGGAMLLDESHQTEKNPWNNDVVGWTPTSQGVGGLYNPRGYGMLRVVLWKLAKGVRQLLYDQPILVENAGAIVIVEHNGRIGLIESHRMVGDRILPNAGAEYVKLLNDRKLWQKLVESLGKTMWEAPRGLIPSTGSNEDEPLEAFVLRTARMEALEEAGLTLGDARIVGRMNMNPTFFAHPQYVVHAKVTSLDDTSHEDLEIIGGRKFFTLDELRKLNQTGDFDDGVTIAALALCGYSF